MTHLKEILFVLKEIILNSNFISTLVGALVALSGVLLSLRAERKKLKQEREYLSKQKAMLAASEAITKFLNYLFTLPDSDTITEGNPVALEISIALNNLHFYCSLDTIEQSVKMGRVLNKTFTDAIKAKLPSTFILEEIKAMDIQIKGHEKTIENIRQEIMALSVASHNNEIVLLLRKHKADVSAEIAKLAERKVSLMKEQYRARKTCREVIMCNSKEIHEAARSVLLMARRELSFPINEKKYKNMLNKATDEAIQNMRDFSDMIRIEIEKKFES